MDSTSSATGASQSSKARKRKVTSKSGSNGSSSTTSVKRTRSKNADADAESEVKPGNPLLIDMVVQEVMGYLDVKELLACRRVCRLWNVEAQEALQHKKYTVNFPTIPAISNFVKLTDTVNRCSPFTKFTLNAKYTPKVRTYFQSLAPQIKTLDVSSLRMRSDDFDDLNNIYSVLNSTPNLENLALHKIDIFGSAYLDDSDVALLRLRKIQMTSHVVRSGCTINQETASETNSRLNAALRALFRLAPNLETLNIDATGFPSETRYGQARYNPLPAFCNAISHVSTLKHLSIEPRLEQRELAYLLNAKFKLESLKIVELVPKCTIHPDRLLHRILFAFLKAQANTIETLDLSLNADYGNCKCFQNGKMELPIMPNLKDLTLHYSQNEFRFGGDMQEIFPKICRLKLINMSTQNMASAFSDFIFVKNLAITIRSPAIRNTNINAALCGLPDPAYTLSAMQKFRDLGICETDISRYEALTLLAAAPSLRDMTNLKTLEICVDPSSQVDDATAYFALTRMCSLEKLIITNANFSAPNIAELNEGHHCVVLR